MKTRNRISAASLWLAALLVLGSSAPGEGHSGAPPSVAVFPAGRRVSVTPEMKPQFERCLREMGRQIKTEFADQVVAYHPILRPPIRIDLSWNWQEQAWAMCGYLLWWKDAQTGQVFRQHAKSLKELRTIVCSANSKEERK